MSNELTVKQEGLVALVEDKNLDEVIKPLKTEIHLFDIFVAGTSHLEDTNLLEELKEGDRLLLQREENKFDPNSILVLTEDQRKKVGYVPEKDNLVFARLMDAGKFLIARISNIDRKGSFTKIRAGIYLVDF